MPKSWAPPMPGPDASEGCGLSVSVRKGELETVERNRDKSLGVTVYIGQRRGNASTSDFSASGDRSKPCKRRMTLPALPPKTRPPGCPMRHDIAPPTTHRDLDLFHPWRSMSSEEAAAHRAALRGGSPDHAQAHHQ